MHGQRAAIIGLTGFGAYNGVWVYIWVWGLYSGMWSPSRVQEHSPQGSDGEASKCWELVKFLEAQLTGKMWPFSTFRSSA